MRIINVIEIIDGDLTPIHSFVIQEEQLSGEVVALAEELFSKIIQENGCPEEDVDSYIEDGYFGQTGEYEVFLIWSDVHE